MTHEFEAILVTILAAIHLVSAIRATCGQVPSRSLVTRWEIGRQRKPWGAR